MAESGHGAARALRRYDDAEGLRLTGRHKFHGQSGAQDKQGE